MPLYDDKALEFIAKWQVITSSELATSQSFFRELCELLEVPLPTHQPDYQFERPITFTHGDGSTSAGRIDCYRRGHFVWESKKVKDGERRAAAGNRRFDEALLKARQQAEDYARALPAAEGRPPFLVVVDVGHVLELYAEFTRSGGTYTPFPDPRSHRIRLQELAEPEVRRRLRALWMDPLSLDPSRISAKVTRAVAAELAELAKSLEADGHRPEHVAGFLTRCLFSMFAEDVGLLPQRAENIGTFTYLLTTYRAHPKDLGLMLKLLWEGMDRGESSPAAPNDRPRRFNGKLFKGSHTEGYVLPLTSPQIDGLLRAASANWQEVEPAIFGTLLERALDPIERHALGAHFTPKAYVERLVVPTVMEPLREAWANAQAAAMLLVREAEDLEAHPPAQTGGTTHEAFDRQQLERDQRALAEHERKVREKWREARCELEKFHLELCTVRVLDPACGSGNFLYVTLEHLKRLEAEVLAQIERLPGSRSEQFNEFKTVTVQQLLGIELNPRAAALAELVLWIGWLQWQVRTQGVATVAEPVVHDYGNIECRDAVLAYDRDEIATDDAGQPLMRWDGRTMKPHPVTGEPVPDETAQVRVWRCINPRPAAWPKADFIVGNPPFIGKLKMREALGDGYVEALRSTYAQVPDSADFVMFWWSKAASTVAANDARRFGFITTNSITMTYNGRLVEHHLSAKPSIYLRYAIPDHPWVDSANGAAVRVAMTVGASGTGQGILDLVSDETPALDGSLEVTLTSRIGRLHSKLLVGVDVTKAQQLRANSRISAMGMILVGSGFIVEPGDPLLEQEPERIRPYLNGRDLTQRSRGVSVIDLYGLGIEEVRSRLPATYQRLYERVKPERDVSKDRTLREQWWLFRRTNIQLREAIAGLTRYIGTTETAKHRLFSFIQGTVTPDQKIRVVGSDDAAVLGVLSSTVHVDWSTATGSRLGVGNDPVYNNTRCFEPFPFPSDDTGLTPELTDRIRDLAEQLDAHRKARQAAHESVTLTGIYNVLEKLRRGEALTAKDKTLHEQALVSVLHGLHEELDATVLAAYGWSDLGSVPWPDDIAREAWTEEVLERLVALNTRRVAEEAAGIIRWLRPAFQNPASATELAPSDRPDESVSSSTEAVQTSIEGLETAHSPYSQSPEPDDGADTTRDARALDTAAAPALVRQPWPADLPAQVKAVADMLQASPGPLSEAALGDRFTGRGPWRRRLPQILSTLEAIGRARATPQGWRA